MRGYTAKTPENVARARELRAQGLTLKDIAAEIGVPLPTVHGWLSDPDGTKLRARKDSYRGVCADCGGPTTGCNGIGSAQICRSCNGVVAAERERARTQAQNEEIARLWREGVPVKDMASRYGRSVATMHCYIGRLRHRGYDVPRRKAMTPEGLARMAEAARRQRAKERAQRVAA